MLFRKCLSQIVPQSRSLVKYYRKQNYIGLTRKIWSFSGSPEDTEQARTSRLFVVCAQQRRFKRRERGAKAEQDEDDDEEDEFEEEPGSKVITGYMASLRADLVLKTGLGMARNKIEALFYESKIRVNGSKIHKKSQKVNVGDELDVLKGPSPINENMMLVSRVTILSAKEHDEEKLVVKMRRYKSLTIENAEL